jgi:hypothetical protein
MNDHQQQHPLGGLRRRMRFAVGVAEVRVTRAAFGDTLGAMREWLDRNDRRPAHFETAADDGGGIIIKLRFNSDDLAEMFQQAFGGSYGAARRTSTRRSEGPHASPEGRAHLGLSRTG